jgi:hypothetical protein
MRGDKVKKRKHILELFSEIEPAALILEEMMEEFEVARKELSEL